MQDGDEEGLRRVEGGEEVSQEEGRSRQEHEARGPGDALQEEQRQGAHRPRPGDATGTKIGLKNTLKQTMSFFYPKFRARPDSYRTISVWSENTPHLMATLHAQTSFVYVDHNWRN